MNKALTLYFLAFVSYLIASIWTCYALWGKSYTFGSFDQLRDTPAGAWVLAVVGVVVYFLAERERKKD